MRRLLIGLALTSACQGEDKGTAGVEATEPGTTAGTTDPSSTSDEPLPSPSTSTTAEPTTEATPTTDAWSSTTEATTDATTDATTGPPPATTVPVFIAQGHLGRTTISCDDGRTWIHNRSQDDSLRCFEDDLDCDHHPYAARGIAYGEGTFMLTWGWGAPGTVVRTEDAENFETVLSDSPTFADIAFGNGRFVLNQKNTQISDDLGKTLSPGGPLQIGINTRAIEFLPHDGGLFLVTGESGEQRAIVRSADGVTWTPASQRPPECGGRIYGMAYGNGVSLVASGFGFVCRSTDGGDTWEQVSVAESFTAPLLWTGEEFFIYRNSTLYRSADGETWESQPISPGNIQIGNVARSPAGTFVAVNAGWKRWYEQQQFFRSEDGVNWEVLPPEAFVGSHPIYFIAHGEVSPGAGCPAE
jgi:hypothetical protein